MKKSDYLRIVECARDPYQGWLNGTGGVSEAIKADLEDILNKTGYMAFVKSPGVIDGLFCHIMKNSSEVDLTAEIIYFDEDVMDEDGRRSDPFFKPDFSPHTLEAFFYFGGLVLIKRDSLEGFDNLMAINELTDECCLKIKDAVISEKPRVCHVPEVMYHVRGFSYYQYKEKDADDSGCKNETDNSSCIKDNNKKISAVILSKDTPDLLRACIDSLNAGCDCELEYIVVDNGSSDGNKKLMGEYLEGVGASYYHVPQPFVYSALCNFGASKATGDLLLFLNDDIVLPKDTKHFPSALLEYAKRENVGAVGVKLIYPDDNPVCPSCIQHVGMTQLAVGPSHKLCSYPDDVIYERGRNRGVWDVLGVTGACLMVEKTKFDEVGGFDERIRISYTDTDLCLDLFEKGYYSVVLNEITLVHCESITRGRDAASEEKLQRLNGERETLYEKHPWLLEKGDPFYSRNLSSISLSYIPDYIQEWEKEVLSQPLDLDTLKEAADGKLLGSIDRKDSVLEGIWDETKGGYEEIEGWTILPSPKIGSYTQTKMEPVLVAKKNNGEICVYSATRKYRPDLEAVFPKETDVLMSGFIARLPLCEASSITQIGYGILRPNPLGLKMCLYRLI